MRSLPPRAPHRLRLRSRRIWRCWLAATAALLLAACGGGDTASPAFLAACRSQANDTPDRLLDCVTQAGVGAHLQALSAIAHTNGGSRATGTPGFDASVRYVEALLREAGYRVTVQPFRFLSYDSFHSLAPSLLEERAPGAGPIANALLYFSGSGDITAPLALPAGDAACTATDFSGFVAGRIALVRSGSCPYVDKANNAFAAGAAAVVIYNDEDGLPEGVVDDSGERQLPALGISRADGEQLRARIAQGLVLHLKTQTVSEMRTSANVLAESVGGDPAQVTMLGAHLDSVSGTAGIDDNGSGTAALLETALMMAHVQPRSKLRFAFWGAEEDLEDGSYAYVLGLDAAERDSIALYLNFDVIASPNYEFHVYSEEGGQLPSAAPRAPAAAAIAQVFAQFYRERGLPWQLLDLSTVEGGSDYESFQLIGVPVGGLFTGTDTAKSAAAVAQWGGSVGAPNDPCYHEACDNLLNIDQFALTTNADAVAWAALYFGMHPLAR